MTIPLVELGGRGPVLALACANGFPPDTYRPMVASLLDRWRVVVLPPRALWPGIGAPPERPGTWESLAEDLMDGLEAHDLRDVVAVGHSFGAISWVLGATRRPGRIRALALLDPTLLPPATMAEIRAEQARGGEALFTLVQSALKRRRRFPSVDEAFTYWRGRPLFADWPADSLRRYAEAMLEPAADGEGLELRWTPEWEAWYYRSFYAKTWDDVARLDPAMPLLALRGATSDTFLPDAATLLAAQAPWGSHHEVPGGHLFPQSHPGEASHALTAFLERL